MRLLEKALITFGLSTLIGAGTGAGISHLNYDKEHQQETETRSSQEASERLSYEGKVTLGAYVGGLAGAVAGYFAVGYLNNRRKWGLDLCDHWD